MIDSDPSLQATSQDLQLCMRDMHTQRRLCSQILAAHQGAHGVPSSEGLYGQQAYPLKSLTAQFLDEKKHFAEKKVSFDS